MLVDSHCHLDCIDLSAHDGKLSEVFAKAHQNGVEKFLCVCIEVDKFQQVVAIAEQYPEVHISVGLHPNVTEEEVEVETLVQLSQHPKCVAIGETGLDYHYVSPASQWQLERFQRHIQAARLVKKPLIIHMRDAASDTLALMKSEKADEVGGVMHCFTEDWPVAKKAIDLGFYISLSGIVTFKNAKSLQDVAQRIPLDKLLIETDSPYLAPVPFRGKPNQPAYVLHVAEKIAELRGTTFEEVAQATTDNYNRLFFSDLSL